MKAALCTAYGGTDVIHLAEVPTPEPGPGEVRIRLHATTVASGDVRVRGLDVPTVLKPAIRLAFGLRRPRQPILGTEGAGVIDAVGPGVARFEPGDAVIAFPGAAQGCHADYRVMPETGRVIAKPPELTFAQAAALCFGGITALHFLTRTGLAPGLRVLVIGASGTVGSAAVQIARAGGAHVTAVTSTANLDLVAGLGADEVIDYTWRDFSSSGQTWDIILDTIGDTDARAARPALAPGGRLALVNGSPGQMIAALAQRHVLAGPSPERRADMQTLAELAETGRYRPLIDSTYPLADIAAAHARVDTGRKRGSVVVALT